MNRWSRLLLGNEPRQRLRLTRTLLATAVYLGCLLLQWQAVWFGQTDVAHAAIETAYLLGGAALFYAAIRSGATLRLVEPALTVPQMLFALGGLAMAYRFNPHFRGTLLMLVALVLIFGAFVIAPRRCLQLGWAAVGMLAFVMAHGAARDPEHFDPQVELVNFLFSLLALPAFSFLAGQLSQRRIEQQRQKLALRDAMARLQRLADHDELTGLPNRRHVQSWIAHEERRQSSLQSCLSIALIDLDHFKRVNDTLGHDGGDEVLRIFARQAGRLVRDGDVLSRWGGEEFLWMMPDTRAPQAEAALARLRLLLASDEAWTDCPAGRVSFSAGLTTLTPPQRLEQALRRADEALYEAKRSGRDRVVVA